LSFIGGDQHRPLLEPCLRFVGDGDDTPERKHHHTARHVGRFRQAGMGEQGECEEDEALETAKHGSECVHRAYSSLLHLEYWADSRVKGNFELGPIPVPR